MDFTAKFQGMTTRDSRRDNLTFKTFQHSLRKNKANFVSEFNNAAYIVYMIKILLTLYWVV